MDVIDFVTLYSTLIYGYFMGKWDKLIDLILKGGSEANISFDELCSLLLRLGFEERIRGSHHLFRKAGIEEKINLQREGNHVKPYQVKQVRHVFLKYRLNSLG